MKVIERDVQETCSGTWRLVTPNDPWCQTGTGFFCFAPFLRVLFRFSSLPFCCFLQIRSSLFVFVPFFSVVLLFHPVRLFCTWLFYFCFVLLGSDGFHPVFTFSLSYVFSPSTCPDLLWGPGVRTLPCSFLVSSSHGSSRLQHFSQQWVDVSVPWRFRSSRAKAPFHTELKQPRLRSHGNTAFIRVWWLIASVWRMYEFFCVLFSVSWSFSILRLFDRMLLLLLLFTSALHVSEFTRSRTC